MADQPKPRRAFVYRGGVRVAGTVLACDAATGTDLVFLSHAPAPGARARRASPPIGGRRQILATEQTLALLGPTGQRLRQHALAAAYGRPFHLGKLRLEIFPSGFMPGSASLLCEVDGRRIVYAGPIAPAPGAREVRAADALCIDASLARADVRLPDRAEALAAVGASVRGALAAGESPVLLVEPAVTALAIATALAADRVGLSAHRDVMLAAAAYRDAGLAAPPLQRFAGRIAPGEALLWPARKPPPARRAGARPHRLVVVSAEPMPPAAAPHVIAFPTGADLAALLSYVAEVGAGEVALVNAPGPEIHRALRARGIDAYPIGPPRQTDLFAADAA
jgi:putative mRNA 3-end processing factor